VFANPGFIEAKVVQPLHQFQVAVDGQCGIFANPVKRSHEYPEFHPLW
jgi:hypothetical protein